MIETRIWITGAHGFIGRYLAKASAKFGHLVLGIGHGAWPPLEAGKWGVSHWLNGEIQAGNLSALNSLAGRPDVVFHLAGGSSVGSAIAQPREDFNRTVVSTMELFEWLRRESPETRVVTASTAAVYGNGASELIRETANLNPYSPYGIHKLMMELLCESYGATYGLRSVIARLFSVYGSGLKKQLLWDLCTKIAANPGNVELGGTGDELRDWVSVSDVAEILVRLGPMASVESAKFNVGTGIGTSVREIARQVVAAWHGSEFGKTALTFNGRSRPGDPFSLVASPAEIARLGLLCGTPISIGILRYVEWFKCQQI